MSDLRVGLKQMLSEKRPLLMGILNVTPDSFSDGGDYWERNAWEQRILEMLAQGAELIDIGGESTRPRSVQMTAEEQLARILEPIRFAVQRGAIVSVDTTLPLVAREAYRAGALILNDISCLAHPELAQVASEFDGWLLLMHNRGAMSTMAGFSAYPEDGYRDVVADVVEELRHARDLAISKGVCRERVWIDPGFGFFKNATHSYALLQQLHMLTSLGVVVAGASRKSFLARDVAAAPKERLGGSIAAGLAAARRGAQILRVHDVLAMRQALAVERAISGGN